ncbi:tetratricopeptide TPR_2 repeat protein [Thermoclostridium stercorarium subsp. stercorarium DSM 8532]|jgi:TolA-binding protein|uniref:Tetratricopeptide TPR_2 repeat protein n=3 Tax=Thermoclostridium stercorarium TaxID=1510 RepID=L7VLU6_THES1|nr:tetratricopeptide repeat protein [Thermoclostridium stercorarium]AGC67687.1 tetratricopeptide TPR_2 repeat protein [Thermoclostridium stercorarium subsp. stercorarium DSM 8532]AGI38735.1 hypothetical protein Clst_0641 [Thermoclostridium stercorarium subsp. stercorarium DSM 8532]ANW98103.1 hypothetical protein CSTERTH_03115 [Thermoclostridium stercorarium subsp. thermolacticum DSM 2910]ANX00646.1 hypothetical protein CSTERLE_03090 [Thermoclostridium stercorarium subsp. leptospartum DSM 9219]
MLDVKAALDDFKPIDIEAVEQKSGKLPENIAEAIKLYNRALEDVRLKSEDIAIIALKKAISLHPVFYEAMNLLGLCYVLAGKDEEAKSVFRKVMEADDSSIKAMEYLKKLQSPNEEDKPDLSPARKRKKAGMNGVALALSKGLGHEEGRFYYIKYVAGFVAGVLITLLIWSMVPTNKSLFTVNKVENIIKDPELVEEISQLNKRIEKLEGDLKDLNEENLRLRDDFQTYKEWAKRLNEAGTEYLNGDFVKSAELLFDTDGTAVPEDLYDYYKSLWDSVRLKAAETLYNEGNKIYNGNKNKDPEIYKQSLEKYETSIAYIGSDKVSYRANLFYQAGKAAARCNEKEKAMKLFQTIIDEYPNTSMSSYATARLNELKADKNIGGN